MMSGMAASPSPSASVSSARSPASSGDVVAGRGADPVADVVVVGAGLAGLACAGAVSAAGRSVVVLEASDGVGGRVRTDVVDGFLLDRGFQVLLTAYPMARQLLDLDALDLRPFLPGARIRHGGRFHTVADPIRRPLSLPSTAIAPIGSVADKVRLGLMSRRAARQPVEAVWSHPEQPTREHLRAAGMSTTVIDRFFEPLFGGIFLDRSLQASSRMFEHVFQMLTMGDSAVPASGMQAIPDQLAARLPTGSIRLRSRVGAVAPGLVTLLDAGQLRARAVVVATEGPQAEKLLAAALPDGTGLGGPVASSPVSCVYFAADRAPVDEPVIVLDAEGASGPVTNLAVMSRVSAAYAPPGRHLIACQVLGSHTHADDDALQAACRAQLAGWFGDATVAGWHHLRSYHIAHAQPRLASLSPHQRPVQLADGLFVAGDHRDQASIQGALASGHRCATAVLASLA